MTYHAPKMLLSYSACSCEIIIANGTVFQVKELFSSSPLSAQL